MSYLEERRNMKLGKTSLKKAAKKLVPLKRTAVKKRSAKGEVKAKEKKIKVLDDAVLYLEIWNERSHKCQCGCNRNISSFSLQLFHHVLPKSENDPSGFPQYRHKKWNIMIITWDCHTAWHNNPDLRPVITEYQKLLLQHHDAGTTDQLGD